MTVLAWLCPFLYMATTMGSILNGLGKTSITFTQNVIAMTLRLLFVLFGIPRLGIFAYLVGALASELLLAFMHVLTLKKMVEFVWNAWDMIAKTFGTHDTGYWNLLRSLSFMDPFGGFPLFIKTALHILILSIFYLVLLFGLTL